MMRKVFLLVALLGLLAGCRTIPVAGECPETARLQCMTRKICQHDEKRGCQRCICEGGWNNDPYDEVKRVEGDPTP